MAKKKQAVTPTPVREEPANRVFEACLTEYGMHSLQSKLPHILDGLKSVQRRILLAHPTSDMPKVVSITGKVLDKYHPYGDASISSTIIRMAQPHNIFVTLMHSPSNVGDYGGGEAAAPRYMEICASDLAQFMYFNNIDHSIFEMQPTEVGNGLEEPKFMVPKVPMALVVASFGIAFGHSSEPANHCLGEVCDMAIEYVRGLQKQKRTLKKVNFYKRLAKFMVPDFPIYQLIRNHAQLVEAYRKGNFSKPIYLDGLMEVHPTKIVIVTMPYGINPRDIWDRIGQAQKQSKPNLINTNISRVEDYSNASSHCDIIISLKRGVNVFELLEPLKAFIGFSRRWAPRYLYILPNGRVDYVDPVRVLEIWHQERTRCIKAELVSGQHKLIRQMRVWEALIKIGSRIREVVDLLLSMKSNEDAIPILCKKYGLNKTQAYAILGYKLSNIPKQEHAALVQQRKEAAAKLNEIQTKFLNADEVVIEDCQATKKRFPEYRTRNAYGPRFIGAVLVEGGIIQFDTLDECLDIVERFGEVDQIIWYPSKYAHKLCLTDDEVLDESKLDLPKEMAGRGLYVGATRPQYTVAISTTNCTARINRLRVGKSTKLRYNHVNGTALGITVDGLVVEFNATELPLVENIDRVTSSQNMLWVGPRITESMVVAYSNRVNELILRRIRLGDILDITTRTQILAVGADEDGLSVAIPERCRSKTTIRHVLLRDLGFVKTKETLVNFTHRKSGIPNAKVGTSVLYN